MSFDHGAIEQARIKAGSYESHGKRKTARHDAGGIRRNKRLAVKRRNVARNRRAHRG